MFALAVLAAGPVMAQQVTQPSSPTPVASANDFATRTFQDPWDMNERTDLGWWLQAVDQPRSGFSTFNFAGSMFSGTVSVDPNLWLLETNSPNLSNVLKNGSTYPLNADVYRVFAVRMRVPQNGGFILWSSAGTIYDPPGLVPLAPFQAGAGWGIHIVDLRTLGAWTGLRRSLRFDPAPDDTPAGSTIDIDWVRLVDLQPDLVRNIAWTGFSGNVDIHLDNDQDAANGTLGSIARNVAGGSYSLNVGALAPGNYFVAIRTSNPAGTFRYSAGYYQVNAPALITVTAPSDEGSADDFATTFLNDPWDMANSADLDHWLNVTSVGIGSVGGAETESGTPLGNPTALIGTSALGVFSPDPCASFAKPALFPLHRDVRGAIHHIDPTRYRILTAEFGMPNLARDLCGGSIFRVVWHVAGEVDESYGRAFALNSRAGANVVNRVTLDMAAMPLEPVSPSQAGWVPGSAAFPGVKTFRVDPHEFANPSVFYIKRLKLAALDTANTSYTVRWTASKTSGTVNVYYDTDKDPAAKTAIGSVSGSATSLVWNTSALPQGAEYFVYVEFVDGLNQNGQYSKWPIRIDHSPPRPRIVLSRTALNFGAAAGTLLSPVQTLRITTIGGAPCWTVATDLTFLVVSPTSGCGNATLSVQLANQAYHGHVDYTGYLRVISSGALNSPQLVRTVLRVRGGSTPPSGFVDTPAEGAVVTGSVPVTGWAIDDIGVTRVTICRNAIPGEPSTNPACAPGEIYLGDAVSIDDARPDIMTTSPDSPLNYRAGWGFLVLTNTLPGQGNSAFTFFVHAFDVEGHRTPIGARTITAANNQASEPFGTIDTPGQGETISGRNYANFGWVLSRVRRADPPGGGHVTVIIDGVAVGTPCCWTRRTDLSTVFPTHPGVNTALGVFGFDTTAYANGLHTIAWVVTDNGGVTSGIGSRFFTVFNASALTLANAMRPAGPDLGRRAADVGGAANVRAIALREGFDLGAPTRPLTPGLDGAWRVWASERGRLEIRLGPSTPTDDAYAGYLVVDGRLRELPLGSSFDPSRGAFYWQPGLGFMGAYNLMFIRTHEAGNKERIPVRVTLQPSAPVVAANNPWNQIRF